MPKKTNIPKNTIKIPPNVISSLVNVAEKLYRCSVIDVEVIGKNKASLLRIPRIGGKMFFTTDYLQALNKNLETMPVKRPSKRKTISTILNSRVHAYKQFPTQSIIEHDYLVSKIIEKIFDGAEDPNVLPVFNRITLIFNEFTIIPDITLAYFISPEHFYVAPFFVELTNSRHKMDYFSIMMSRYAQIPLSNNSHTKIVMFVNSDKVPISEEFLNRLLNSLKTRYQVETEQVGPSNIIKFKNSNFWFVNYADFDVILPYLVSAIKDMLKIKTHILDDYFRVRTPPNIFWGTVDSLGG